MPIAKFLVTLLSGGVAVSASIGATFILKNKDNPTATSKQTKPKKSEPKQVEDPFKTTSLSVTKKILDINLLRQNYTAAKSALEAAKKEYQEKLTALREQNASETATTDTSFATQAAAAESKLGAASQAWEHSAEELILFFL